MAASPEMTSTGPGGGAPRPAPRSSARLRRLLRLGPRRWAFLARVALTAAVIELAVRVLPLPTVARAAGVPLAAGHSRGTAPAALAAPDGDAAPDAAPDADGWARLTDRDRARGELALRAVEHRPFRATCLRRSLLLGHLLRHHHPALRLGVKKTDGVVSAHAWVEVDGVSLDPDAAAYRTLAVPAPRSHR